MIKVWYKDGRYVPIITCDICNERIEDAAVAAAVAPSGEPDKDQVLDVLHAHKGRCHEAAEHKLGGDLNTGWEELSVHVLYLARNVKLSPEALIKLGKQQEEVRF